MEGAGRLVRRRLVAVRQLGLKHGQTRLGFGITRCGRDGIPLEGIQQALRHAVAALIQHRQVELAVRQAQRRGLGEPARRLGHVLAARRAAGERHRQIVHGLAVALVGGQLVIARRLGGIGRHALAALIQRAQAVLRHGLALVGGLGEVLDGVGQVDRRAVGAVQRAQAQDGEGDRVAGIGQLDHALGAGLAAIGNRIDRRIADIALLQRQGGAALRRGFGALGGVIVLVAGLILTAGLTTGLGRHHELGIRATRRFGHRIGRAIGAGLGGLSDRLGALHQHQAGSCRQHHKKSQRGRDQIARLGFLFAFDSVLAPAEAREAALAFAFRLFGGDAGRAPGLGEEVFRFGAILPRRREDILELRTEVAGGREGIGGVGRNVEGEACRGRRRGKGILWLRAKAEGRCGLGKGGVRIEFRNRGRLECRGGLGMVRFLPCRRRLRRAPVADLGQEIVVFLLQRLQPVGQGLHGGIETGRGVLGFQPLRDAGDGLFDPVQSALESGIGQTHFQPGDGIFQTVQAFLSLGGAALVLDLVGGALARGAFDLLQRMVQRIGVELGGLFGAGEPLFDGFKPLHVAMFGILQALGQRLGGDVDALFQLLVAVFGIHTGLAHAVGQLLQVAGQLGDLAGGIVGGGGDLVGQPGQALVQRLDRVLDAVIGGRAFQPFQPLVQRHHVQAQLVEGLGLFAGMDVDFLRGARQDPVALAVTALGGIQAAAQAPQLVFDAAPGVV